MAGVFTALACRADAHINPAVTLGFGIVPGDFSKLAPSSPAQVLGAIAGQCWYGCTINPHWRVTPDWLTGSELISCHHSPDSQHRGKFAERSASCIVLVLLIASIFSKAVAASGPAAALGPFLVGAVVWAIGLSLGGTTCFPINPARDLGPRIAHSILPIAGNGDSDWGYAMVPVIGALVGGALAGVFIKMMF
jgi:glycerol uptake facilitator protein